MLKEEITRGKNTCRDIEYKVKDEDALKYFYNYF